MNRSTPERQKEGESEDKRKDFRFNMDLLGYFQTKIYNQANCLAF